MGRKGYSWEIRERAEELYVFEGLGFKEVSAETGVSESQLKRWADEGDWSERKKEHRKVLTDLKRKKLQIHRKLVQDALDTLDHQAVMAARRWMATHNPPETATHQRDRDRDIDRPALFLENLEFIARTLEEIDPRGLNVLAKNHDAIIDRFKAQCMNATPSGHTGTIAEKFR